MFKNILVSVVVSAIISVGIYSIFFGGNITQDINFAGVTGLAGLNITKDGLKVGTTTPTFKRFGGGTCYLAPYSTTIAATSTATVDCQGTLAWNATGSRNTSVLSGVKNNDPVLATLSTTTAGTTSLGIRITGASASSTQGFITLRIANQTGTIYTWPSTGIASGTASYWLPATAN